MQYLRKIILGSGLGIILILNNPVSAQNKKQKNSKNNTTNLIKLVLNNNIYTLDFKKNPELLNFTPQYFLKVQDNLIHIDPEKKLLNHLKFLDIKSISTPEISVVELKKYIEKLNFSGSKPQTSIKLNKTKKGWIKISGFPTRKYFDIDIKNLTILLNHALKNKNDFVRVPADFIYPKVEADESIINQGIKEIIAIGESNFTGSSGPRVQNIRAALRKFNGTVLKKDEIFSFNGILKSVEEKDGFVKELVIKADGNKKELGGGVCQVSTTVFRAAFSGGLPLVSRRNHSYAVPYYKPHGIDATIYLGGQDFKFKNDTDGDILIQGFMIGSKLYFVFYGTPTGKTVELKGPFFGGYRNPPEPEIIETDELPAGQTRVVSTAHTGFFSRWIRIITDKKGVKTSEELNSVYRPWPAKILKGKTPKTEEKKISNPKKTIRTPNYDS